MPRLTKTQAELAAALKKQFGASMPDERAALARPSGSVPTFEDDTARCELCGGTGNVDVIPRGGGANDARMDECPWCLRRKLNALNRRGQ